MKEFLGLPLDASAHGPQIDQMIVLLHWLMAFLFVVWGIFFVYTLLRFRSARQPKADYAGVKTHASSYLEVGVAVFEGVLLVAFAIPVWSGVVTAFPDEENAVVIHVVAEQFAWNVHYPGPDGVFGPQRLDLVTAENPLGLDRDDPSGKDDITTINQLTVPVGKNILIYLSSKDVIHSFGVPMLRVKQDAIPGQRVPVWFNATMTNEQVRASTARSYSLAEGGMPEGLAGRILWANYQAADGSPLASKGDLVTDELLASLRNGGVATVVAVQDTPMEVVCSQLCGLGHYRMRATVTVLPDTEFQAWLEEEASYL
jgi:cytochrome c oxidase subunit 2